MTTTRTPQRRAVTPATTPLVRDIENVRNRIRHFFDAPLGRLLQEPFFTTDLLAEPLGWVPAAEVDESDTEYTVTLELPGMSRDDVQVEFEDGVLTISGEKLEEREEEKKDRRQLIWERSYGRFERSFGFPGVDEARITATMKDGVMKVTLPKMEGAKSKGRRIVVTNGK